MAAFTHEAFFYADTTQQFDAVTEFILAGLRCGDLVVVMLGEPESRFSETEART